jgi:hypothetical protein
MVAGEAQVFRGAVDLLILEAAWLGPLGGYGMLPRIRQNSRGALLIEHGWDRVATAMAFALGALPEET